MLRNLKLRTKMLIVFLEFNFLVALIGLLVTQGFARTVLVKQVQNGALERVRSAAHAIDGFLGGKAKAGLPKIVCFGSEHGSDTRSRERNRRCGGAAGAVATGWGTAWLDQEAALPTSC